MAAQDREEEQQEQSFTVSDKRLFTKDGARREGSPRPEPTRPDPPPPPPPQAAEPPPRPSAPEPPPGAGPDPSMGMPPGAEAPPADFSTYVIMLANTVMMMLGQVPDPVTQQRRLDLVQAKHTIDILMMLGEKTQGNLDAEEEKLLADVLPQLQMAYVQISRQAGAPG